MAKAAWVSITASRSLSGRQPTWQVKERGAYIPHCRLTALSAFITADQTLRNPEQPSQYVSEGRFSVEVGAASRTQLAAVAGMGSEGYW